MATYGVWNSYILDNYGNAIVGAQITVTRESDGAAATLYSTRSGTSLANPFTSDGNGFASFYALPGLYKIVAVKGGTTQTLRYVPVGIAGDTGNGWTASADGTLQAYAGGTLVYEVKSNGDMIVGAQSALATNATGGFQFVPATAGTPTGTPANAPTGKAPIVVDTTNNRFWFYAGSTWRAGREVLTAARTYYVRTDGSDSNTGLADTSGGAFWTIQKAIDTIASIDIGTQAVTIQLGDGTHTGAISVKGPWLGTGTVTLRGNSSTPANVVVKSTSGNLLTLSNGARLTASYLEFQTATSTYACVVSTSGSQFLFGPGLRFGACSYAHMQAYNGGTIYGRQAYSIVGSATIHIQVVDFGGVDISGVDLTLVGTPAFTQYAYASRGGMLTHYSVNVVSGSATGQRYDVSYNSVIFTAGGTLPGSTAGAAATGGVYG